MNKIQILTLALSIVFPLSALVYFEYRLADFSNPLHAEIARGFR